MDNSLDCLDAMFADFIFFKIELPVSKQSSFWLSCKLYTNTDSKLQIRGFQVDVLSANSGIFNHTCVLINI